MAIFGRKCSVCKGVGEYYIPRFLDEDRHSAIPQLVQCSYCSGSGKSPELTLMGMILRFFTRKRRHS